MLNDSWRTRLMVRAVESAVRPGDVVLDIGTGTGILALAAARAGARRVFALESGAMAPVAAAMVEANGFSDRIEVIRGLSSRVKLPEKVDLVMGEILGNDPLGEGISRAYRDAARRLARADARYLPCQLDLWVCPVYIPPPIFDAWTFSARNVEAWLKSYGFDFSPLLRFIPSKGEYRLASPAVVDMLEKVGPRLKLMSCCPQDLLVGVPEATIMAEVPAGDRVNGVLLGWTAHLTPGLKLEVFPPLPDSCHWHLPAWVLPLEIKGPASMQIHWSFQVTSSFEISTSVR